MLSDWEAHNNILILPLTISRQQPNPHASNLESVSPASPVTPVKTTYTNLPMMSALLPLISEILPMIMPASANITRAKQLEPTHPTVEGPVIERPAVVGKCDRMCVSVLTARPHQNSTVRHNSEQDAIFYAVSGNGILAVSESVDSDPKNHELSPGDFAFVPAWTEHQIKNETDEDVVFLVIQSGPTPIRADLTDWGGDMVKSRK